jgi:hypothetical protein
MRDLSKYLLNDKAKNKVKYLNEQGKAAIQMDNPGDRNLAAYKVYVEKFNELKEKYPNWEGHLDSPIPYSQFVLDYDETLYSSLLKAERSSLKAPEFYALKIHGVNESSLDILYNELTDRIADPHERARWLDIQYFRSHIPEAYSLLRQYIPDDEEYDNVFSPKEEMLSFGI